MTDYESLLARIIGIQAPARPDDRSVEWVDGAEALGVARTYNNRVELFIPGPEIEARLPSVRENLAHQTWYRTSGGSPEFEASRLVLPAAGHFNQVAAFICTELFRNGVTDDAQRAFTITEPVIDLALMRLHLSDQALTGLIGELLLMEAMLDATQDGPGIEAIFNAWAGFGRSSRDFALGKHGVEVKTTTTTASSHHVQGVHQVEPQGAESALTLVSISIEWLGEATDGSDTLPGLANRIVQRVVSVMGAGPSQQMLAEFLVHVHDYGGGGDSGYDHSTMAENPGFTRPFRLRFVRGYDMTDRNIKVIRTEDIVERPHTDLTSVEFRVLLPTKVSGDLNPVVGLNKTASSLIGIAPDAGTQ